MCLLGTYVQTVRVKIDARIRISYAGRFSTLDIKTVYGQGLDYPVQENNLIYN